MCLRCFHCSFLHKWRNWALSSTYRIGNEKIRYLNLTLFFFFFFSDLSICHRHVYEQFLTIWGGEINILQKLHVHIKLFSQGLCCKWLEAQVLGFESELGIKESPVVHSAVPSLQLSQTGCRYLLYSGGCALRLKGRSVNKYPVSSFLQETPSFLCCLSLGVLSVPLRKDLSVPSHHPPRNLFSQV